MLTAQRGRGRKKTEESTNLGPDGSGTFYCAGRSETASCMYVLPWPPVYRSDFFPVFLHTGNRRYMREPHRESLHSIFTQSDRFVKFHFAQTGPSPPADPDSAALSSLIRQLQQSCDELQVSPSFRYMSNFATRSKSIITSAAGFLPTNIFTWKQSSGHDEHTEPPETSQSARSHCPQLPECFRSRRDSRSVSRCVSAPSLSQLTCAETESLKRAESLPAMMLNSSFEEFTPDISAEGDDESYSFQCSGPGLYQCSVTGLLFDMEGEGDVVYRLVPWNRRLLAPHHKKPAGPLFDIKCVQQCVRQLHLPHCEIRSTGGGHFLSVAHVNDEAVEFIGPHQTTETHLVINISGFSAFGNVKDEDAPPEPVRALVLLFYRPPADPDPESLLNVLLLPRNVPLRDVLRTRKKLVGDETYIETSPHCKLIPGQVYTLSTCPEDHSLLVQPTEAEFDSDNYDDYFPSFQVSWETRLKHVKLVLRDSDGSHSAWERRVCLWSSGGKRWCGPSPLNVASNQRLLDVRSSFIDGISGPVLKSLLDKLFEKRVMSDSERESADETQNKRDKARLVVDTVRRKGEAASSEMIELLCELDPFLCEHLELT
ncbi:NACHT, LRR and PYD domains-containing protein 1-like [Lates calcarifer]|uniref:NACHT, LRR and PYD domains-containing protein 1-like n=1 Tax=Lates calcarifer TaxID=8187 RepID=A0AAJ7LXH6_LATCA|nr:NACHT, LRR and PYD domains-containing protein 1-like [Lates calcarifer]